MPTTAELTHGERINQPSFSIVLIARNEATSLPRLMESLREFQQRGGRVCLTDTGSTDGTPEVARSLGCEVTEAGERFLFTITEEEAAALNERFVVAPDAPVVNAGDRLFDFAAARNFAAAQAPTNWVSFADADEAFTVMDIDEVEKSIADPEVSHLEYEFCYAHNADGSPAVAFRQSKAYDKTRVEWSPDVIVHEVLRPIPSAAPGRARYVPDTALRLEHWQEPNREHRSKYLVGLLHCCYYHPENDRNSHYCARELMYTERYRSAIKEFERHVHMNAWKAERAQSLIFMGDCWGRLNEPDRQAGCFHAAFHLDSTRRCALLRLAAFYDFNKNWQAALCYAKASLDIPWHGGFYADDRRDYEDLPHYFCYRAAGWLGRIDEAQHHIRKALEFCPNNPEYQRDLPYYFGGPAGEYKGQGIDGWMSITELNWLYEQAKNCKSVLEIGSWKGRSTHALLSACQGTVTAVDTWQGSTDPGDWTNSLAKQADIFAEFQKNVGHFPNLEVLRMTSAEAAELCKDRKFDMIFVDANHTEEGCSDDILRWKDKATKVFSGHDYTYTWLGVKAAVDKHVGKLDGVIDTIWFQRVDATPQIPKRIFTIWLGEDGTPPPDLVQKCIASQKIPGYEHVVLGIADCPKGIPYLDAALAAKKWVKACDYLRMYELYERGGIYLDADVEVLPGRNFDDLLRYSLFAGREENGFISSAIMGSAAGHPLIREHLAEVVAKFKGDDDKNFESSLEILTSRVYAAAGSDAGISILEPEYFFPYNHQTGITAVTANTRVFHHFMKSWVKTEA